MFTFLEGSLRRVRLCALLPHRPAGPVWVGDYKKAAPREAPSSVLCRSGISEELFKPPFEIDTTDQAARRLSPLHLLAAALPPSGECRWLEQGGGLSAPPGQSVAGWGK